MSSGPAINVTRFMAVAAMLLSRWAIAGPPYVADDPEPPELGHWEIFQFVGGAHAPGSTEGTAGIDLNYGYSANLQLTAVVPLGYEHSSAWHSGLGVVETAAKYRFLRASADGGALDVALFPRIFWPTGSSRFGSRQIGLLLPLWAQRDWDRWSVFGGGGWQLNSGDGNRDFWLTGIGVSRAIGPRLELGAEIYHHSPDTAGSRSVTGVNVGAIYALGEHWSVLASAGPAVHATGEAARYAFFFALRSDY